MGINIFRIDITISASVVFFASACSGVVYHRATTADLDALAAQPREQIAGNHGDLCTIIFSKILAATVAGNLWTTLT